MSEDNERNEKQAATTGQGIVRMLASFEDSEGEEEVCLTTLQ